MSDSTNTSFCLNPEIAKLLHERYKSILEGFRTDLTKDQEEFAPKEVPSVEHIQKLIEVSFWACLKKEEGRQHSFSLTFTPPEQAPDPFIFIPPLPFNAEKLAKLAPALHNQMASIGVWTNDKNENDKNGLVIWGLTPSTDQPFSVKAYETGHLLISYYYQGTVLITGSKIEFIDSAKFSLINNLLYGLSPNWNSNWNSKEEFYEALGKALAKSKALVKENDFKRIAKAMLSHTHGGTLLVVQDNEAWKNSINLSYGGIPYEKVKSELRARDDMMESEPDGFSRLQSPSYQASVEIANRSLKLVGQLTAVDGATVVTYDLKVLGFGAKIKPINVDEKPNEIFATEPFEGSIERIEKLSDLGGTRHQSAAQFVYDQKDSFALVASQDGRLSAFAWDPNKQAVSVIRHAEYASF